MRYKRSEALPGFTVDLARGTLVAEGVPAAALTSSFGGLSVDIEGSRFLVQQAFGVLAELGQRRALGGYLVGRISILASKTRLTTMLPRDVQALFPAIATLKGAYTKQKLSSGILVKGAGEIDAIRAAINPLTIVKPGRGSSSRWAARVSQRLLSLDLIGSFVVAVGVDVLFSVYEDIGMRDIYGLTNEQIAGRTLVHGGGAALSALVVMGLGYAIMGTACPPFWFGIPVFLCAEILWERGIAPMWYEQMGLYGPYEPRQPLRTLDLGALERRRFMF